MHVIVVFPDIGGYIDRIVMFAALSEQVASLHLLTRPSYAAEQFAGRWKQIVVHTLNHPGKRAFQRAAIQTSVGLIKGLGKRNGGVIVQDIIAGRAALPFGVRRRFKQAYNVRNVVSLYSDNLGYVFDTLLGRQDGPSSSLRKQLPTYRLYAQRILVDYLVYRLADGITCNSPAAVTNLTKWFGARAHLAVLPTEIDASRYRPPSELDRTKMGVPEGRPLLLFVGLARQIKGIYIILEALRRLRDRQVAFQMLFVGGVHDQERAEVQEMIQAYHLQQQITILPHLPNAELAAYYAMSDVLLCPSLSEGSPRVVKEALLCGCPVIGSDLPGIRMLDPAGNYIRFIPARDPEALAAAIVEVTSAPDAAKAAARAGGEQIRHMYAPEAVARHFLRFYESLFSC
ncbi:MAG TPA: glycosyltransferase family 4 protein [Caldilineaceae bacterium]|nr:glycosyltransferase family 4 protein [Caldilineaceae bacterium]